LAYQTALEAVGIKDRSAPPIRPQFDEDKDPEEHFAQDVREGICTPLLVLVLDTVQLFLRVPAHFFISSSRGRRRIRPATQPLPGASPALSWDGYRGAECASSSKQAGAESVGHPEPQRPSSQAAERLRWTR